MSKRRVLLVTAVITTAALAVLATPALTAGIVNSYSVRLSTGGKYRFCVHDPTPAVLTAVKNVLGQIPDSQAGGTSCWDRIADPQTNVAARKAELAGAVIDPAFSGPATAVAPDLGPPGVSVQPYNGPASSTANLDVLVFADPARSRTIRLTWDDGTTSSIVVPAGAGIRALRFSRTFSDPGDHEWLTLSARATIVGTALSSSPLNVSVAGQPC